MATLERPRTLTAEQSEANISHFIPPVELTGSRAEKLRRLDTLIAYLEALRIGLAGPRDGQCVPDVPSRHAADPSWPWFTAGTLLGALFMMMVVAARSCG